MNDQETANKAKFAEARHLAKNLLKTANISAAPVYLNSVVQHVPAHFSLVVKGTTALPMGVDAFTYSDNEITIIGYQLGAAKVRQRFSVAHELGHLFMGHVHGQSSINLNTDDHDEAEANQFAAHLMMPPAFLRKDIKDGGQNPSMLALKYEVSEEALWWQLTKCGLLSLF